MQVNQRDAGLIRAIGVWPLAATAVSMIVGAGIFAVPAALAASIGPYGPLVFLACGVATAAVAVCFAEGGTRIPTSGGVYGFIEAALGPLPGYVAGTLFWVACVLACGGVAAALADAVATLAPPAFTAPLRTAVIIAVIAGIALVNIAGVTRGAALVTATTALKVLVLLIFVAAGATAVHRANFTQAARPDTAALGRAFILGMFSFAGMETALCASGEVTLPRRTIPRALMITIVLTTTLYVSIQLVAQGLLGASLATSKAPLADAMAQVHPLLRTLLLAGGSLSMFGYLSSDLLGSPRQLFALARDGLMPRGLGRLLPSTHAPFTAIASYAAIAIALALTGTFAELAVLSTLAIAALYVVACVAAWMLVRRGVACGGEPLNFRFLGSAAITGVLSMLVVIGLGSTQEILGLVTLIALSVLVYLVQTRATLLSH